MHSISHVIMHSTSHVIMFGTLCISFSYFSLIISDFFVQVEDMIQHIQETFKKSLDQNNWMDEETKTAAVKKVNHRE